jgi:hypothetical protein
MGLSLSPGRVDNFLFSISSRQALGVHPTYPVDTRGSFPGGRLRHEADHSPAANAEVKKM